MSRQESGTRRHDPLRRSLLAVLFVSAAIILTTAALDDPDLWGHVRYGLDVLDTGRLPETATYTFTAPDHPWINHENLSELTFAFVVRHSGAAGLVALRCLLGMAMVALMMWSAQRQAVSSVVTVLVLLLGALNFAPGWTVRPQLFTYVYFALLIFILDRCFEDWPDTPPRPRWLWLVLPLFVLWVNTHGGFVAGFFVLGLYLGCRAVEAWMRVGRQSLPQISSWTLLLLATAAATLVNPYGIHLLLWLLADLTPPRPEITEWRALTFGDPRVLPFALLLGLTTLAWLASRRRRDPAQTAVLVVVVWQSFAHARHISFFGILAAFWLPVHVEDLRQRLLSKLPAAADEDANAVGEVRGPLRMIRLAMWLMTIGLLVVLADHLRGFPVSKNKYPVEAFAFMGEHGLTGKMVVHFDWSQYALAAFAPATSVNFDGRFRTCYPQEAADMAFDFEIGPLPGNRWRSDKSPPLDDTRVLEFGAPDLVLVSRRLTHSAQVMAKQPGWVLLYQDAMAQLWGRGEKYDDSASPDYLAPQLRSITDTPQSGTAPWPALPRRGQATDGFAAGRAADSKQSSEPK